MPAFLTVPPDATFETVRQEFSRHRRRHIVLELPPDWTELDNVARMRLLLRQAQAQQTPLALVTRHQPARKSAAIAGIPVYTRRQDVPGDFHMRPIAPRVNPRQPLPALPEAPAWRRDRDHCADGPPQRTPGAGGDLRTAPRFAATCRGGCA